ncbi:hypothetical protein AAON49_04510 [Pseudotenacibaculum sp. MALMAid0570]|uniref:hypothetical protein n=1 Tax=Pseudotenacibaculum sp. MALMAid0570 TaxID=3143938 RepID=UPI0032DEE536
MISKGYSYRKISGILFFLFILSVGLHKSNYLINQLSGVNIESIIGITLLAFPLLFLFLSYYYSPSRRIYSIKRKDSFVVNIIFFYVHCLLVYGVIRGNDLSSLFQEYWTSLVILLAYKISSEDYIWKMFEGKLRITFFVFAGLVFLGRSYTLEHLSVLGYDALETGNTTAVLSYTMAPMLDFWPFLFLLPFFNKEKKVRNKILIFLPLIVYLGFQLYFLKRAPSARAISFLILATAINMKITGNSKIFIRQIFLLGTIASLMFVFTPEALVKRFQTKDTARQDEAVQMISQLSVYELLIGRGLGGDYVVNQGGIVQFIDNKGKPVSTSVHIGAVYPILKGGFFFFFLVLFHILSTVYKSAIRIKELSSRELSCLVFLIIYSLFRLIEGPLTPGSVFDALLFGMSLGYLNRKSENIKPNII